jgi:hypothetical protein
VGLFPIICTLQHLCGNVACSGGRVKSEGLCVVASGSQRYGNRSSVGPTGCAMLDCVITERMTCVIGEEEDGVVLMFEGAEMRCATGLSSSVEVMMAAVASMMMESKGFNSGDGIHALTRERKGVWSSRPFGVCRRRWRRIRLFGHPHREACVA